MTEAIRLFYKYGIAFLYLIIIITYSISGSDFYIRYYEQLSQLFSFGLFFCLYEYASAVVYRKCVWQKGCIVGVTSYCVINILFTGNYEILYYDIAQILSFLVASLFISTYIYVEEFEGKLSNKREKNDYIRETENSDR